MGARTFFLDGKIYEDAATQSAVLKPAVRAPPESTLEMQNLEP